MVFISVNSAVIDSLSLGRFNVEFCVQLATHSGPVCKMFHGSIKIQNKMPMGDIAHPSHLGLVVVQLM